MSSKGEQTYNIASWEVSDGVLSSEWHGAEHDEHQDEVGEDVMIDESVAEHANPGGKTAQTETWDTYTSMCVYVNHVKFFLRVCAAEDEEGASLWDGSDLLLLDQVGDDRPGPRWNLWVVLLPRRVVLFLLLTDRKHMSEYWPL